MRIQENEKNTALSPKPVSVLDLKSNWLQEQFSKAATCETENGVTTALPGCYVFINPGFNLKNIFRRISGRSVVSILPVTGAGPTEKDSRDNLATKFFHAALLSGMVKFRPKEGQDEMLLSPQRMFEMIGRRHRLHDHESLDLFDFNFFGLDLDKMQIREMEFDDFHCHLRPL